MKQRKKRQPHGRRRHETNGSGAADSSQSIPDSPSSTESSPQQQSLLGEMPVIFQHQNPEAVNLGWVGLEEELPAQSAAIGFGGWELSEEWFRAQVGELRAFGSWGLQGEDFQQDLVESQRDRNLVGIDFCSYL